MTRLLEIRRFDGKTSGIIGVINAIKWLGIREWIICCFVRHELMDEGHVWNMKTGN